MKKSDISQLKSALLGFISGGALTALHAYSKSKDSDYKKDLDKDKIIVPLSKRHYLKALRSAGASIDENIPSSKMDVAGMSPKDIATLKRELLRKHAEFCAPEKIVRKEGPSSAMLGIRRSDRSTYIRDSKGRFSTEDKLKKKAGFIEDSNEVVGNYVGAGLGMFTGIAVMKKLTDRIILNKKLKQLEQSRRIYAESLGKEVNDVDIPYYNKKTASDRGMLGNALGLVKLTGLATTGITGLIVYRIMENRRKQEEKDSDKDTTSYPNQKNIEFKFASADSDAGFFPER